MSLFREVYEEVKELHDRLWALRVNYPDTEVRVKHSIFLLKEVLDGVTDQKMEAVMEDLNNLNLYLVSIIKLDPKNEEVVKDFGTVLMLIEKLMGPTYPEEH